MPILLKAILLGLIQGLTEFLPISSSGHLVIFQDFFGFHENSLLFDVFLHVGTLVPIVVIFWKDIGTLLTTRRRWVVLLGLGTVPIVVVGALFADQIEAAFQVSRWVGALLLLNGCVLLVGGRLDTLRRAKRAPGWLHAAAVGLAQAAAILPGLSRSGSTISTGLATGLDREDAASFSFLLAIPAILLALVFNVWRLLRGTETVKPTMWVAIAVGTLVAMVVGYAALRVLLAAVRRGKLGYFGWYCLAVGAALVVYHLVR